MLKQVEHIIQSAGILLPDEIFAGLLILLIAYISFSRNFDKIHTQKIFNIILAIILLSFCFVYYGFKQHYVLPFQQGINIFNNLVFLDNWAIYFKILILISAALVLLHIVSTGYELVSEFYVFFLAAIFGLLLLSMTTHLLMLYISLEFVSIASYILVAYQRQKHNFEASIKYLLFGAISSAVMLYGISWLYGMTGTLNFADKAFAENLLKNPTWIVALVSLMSMGGMLFKLSSAPFHVWTPDVYEATPTPIVAFLSIAPKAAAMLALYRFLSHLGINSQVVLGTIIIISLTIGNFSALWQKDVKRMLGYSAIAHSGFMLVGLLALNKTGFQTSIFYVSTYLFITLGAFLLVDIISKKTNSTDIESFVGIGQENIFLGISAVVIMIALVGLPPTVGFSAKLLVFTSLWNEYQQNSDKILFIVLLVGLANTAVSVFYYLKVPYYMIIKKSDNHELISIPSFQQILLGFFVAFILYLFFAPNAMLRVIESL